MIYTSLGDKSELKQAGLLRKLLDLIKKKYKDDLMENLLQEEYSSLLATNGSGAGDVESGGTQAMAVGKAAKKKKKKAKDTNPEND